MKDSLVFNGSIVGGLSGIDYANGHYYFVVDDSRDPRFLKAKINIQKNKIENKFRFENNTNVKSL